LSTGDASDRIREPDDLSFVVVRGEAGAHRAGQSGSPIRRHLAFDFLDRLPAHVEKVEDIWIGAEAAVAYGHTPFVA
jgi:hypothetical protein